MLGLILLTMPAMAQNLVSNPGFSRGIFQPEDWDLNQSAGNRVVWLCDRGDASRCGLRLVGSGQDWAGASSRRIAAGPGQVLTVAAWVMTRDVRPGGGRLYVRQFRGGSFTGQSGPDVPANAPQWTLCAGTVTTGPDTGAVDVSLQLWSTGEVTLGTVGLFAGDVAADLPRLLPRPAPLDPVEVRLPMNVPPDANGNGLGDRLEEFLQVPPGTQSTRRTRRVTTCFQTPTGYREDNDLKVDAILVVNDSAPAITSWQRMGYRAWFMTGFRDGPAYVQAHPGSVQQGRGGNLLDCGPGSYYMVPTADRRAVLRERCRGACANGAEAVAPEEPEFIGSGGYSPAFQKEFAAFYGRPWVAPHTSVQARVDCQRLMGHLEVELLRACYDGARQARPDAQTFMLCHSPLNYSAWNIMFPHREALRELRVDQMISQVWTGTARSAINHQGRRRERTFENAWLEYSSTLELVRGLGIPTWLLMDPVEDNPDRPMADYFDNYKRTLAAAMMFPQTDRFEVMPWPTRIFGRVPGDFATVICNVVAALSDLQNCPQARHDRGTEGIGTFLGDSAMWQRGEPRGADFDSIYGLCLPLLMRGIPAQIASLDRLGEAGYLDPYKVLLVSFDAVKPQTKANVDGLAAWVRAGGQLVVCGGSDPYNDLDLWWKREGCASPHEYLLRALGLRPQGMKAVQEAPVQADFKVVAETDYQGHNLENRATVRLDLTPFARDTGAVLLKLEDTIKADGWGPWIGGLRLLGTRGGKALDVAIKPGSAEEGALVVADSGSGFDGTARFVDGTAELFYRVEFDPGTRAEVDFDIGNQYRISAAAAPARLPTDPRAAEGSLLGADLVKAGLPALRGMVLYPDPGGTPALVTDAGVVVTEATVGRGGVTVCGAPPALFTRSPAGDRMLRALVKHACGRAAIEYREQGHLGIQRGPYVVVKALDQEAPVEGPVVDLFTPDLALRPAGPVAPDGVAVLKRLPAQTGRAPVLAATSACVEYSATVGDELRLVASGPRGVTGAMRLVTSGEVEVAARDATGQERPVAITYDRGTALLRFDLQPQGLGLCIRRL